MSLSTRLTTLLLSFGASLLALASSAQVTLNPAFADQFEEVTVLFDACEGTAGLCNFDGDVYIHTGVVLASAATNTSWSNVPTTWAVANPAWKLDRVAGSDNLYTITYNINDFYNLAEGEEVDRLGFVFRNADGSREGKATGGSDIFYDLYDPADGFQLRVQRPFEALSILAPGDSLVVEAQTSEDAEFQLERNGVDVVLGNGKDFRAALIVEPGRGEYVLKATNITGEEIISDVIGVVAAGELAAAPVPSGTPFGFSASGTTATFHLYTPEKAFAYVNILNRDGSERELKQLTPTPDSTGFWTTTSVSSADEELIYQYIVDGSAPIADPFSDLILDPNNDAFIDENTFADIPDVPGLQGLATWVRPGGDYDFQHDDYDRPEEGELVIYELLIRDFVAEHDYATLIDSLPYFERLGINAIELMPIQEFSGNLSWGYNPTYHHAIDKYYGPPEDLKRFVDECHARGIAVIIDVVFNQGDGLNPYFQLYAKERAAAPDGVGPFFNTRARHPFNVFNDFNHESPYVQQYVGQTVQDWLLDYHIDGYRFDLSKGFTQTDYGDDVAAWGRYDQGRVDILKGYQDSIREVDADNYVILEHLSDNDEEQVLAEAGMMLWGNMSFNYAQFAMGYNSQNDLFAVTPQGRNFDSPRLIGYMESHDEERMQYKLIEFGNRNSSYSSRTYSNRLQRGELAAAFFYTTPGPKMLWQFGEYGYDIDINFNGRTGDKPIKWELLEEAPNRRLFDVTRSLIMLRSEYDVFRTGEHELPQGLNGGLTKSMYIRGDDAEFDVLVVGNGEITPQDIPATFPGAGTYYSYFTGDSLTITSTGDVEQSLSLEPGVYRLYTSKRLPAPPMGFVEEVTVSVTPPPATANVSLSPNPVADRLNISVEGWTSTSMEVQLYSSTGQLLQSRMLGADQRLDVDVSGLAAGSYYAVFAADNGAMLVKPFVK